MKSFKKVNFYHGFITVSQGHVIDCKVLSSVYCILRGWIKGFNSSITTILFEVGIYRTVVGYLWNARVVIELWFY